MRRTMTMLMMLIAVSAGAAERAVTAEDAKAIFAKFKAFEGKWKAKSTKGWTETNTYEIAGKGSVVINRSFFEDEPNDGMLTTIYLDGDRLLMTHYCEARNQPTLIASTIDDETNRVVFKFLSGTNMKSRDAGHMDSAVYQFIDADHVRSRWSWYANGEGAVVRGYRAGEAVGAACGRPLPGFGRPQAAPTEISPRSASR